MEPHANSLQGARAGSPPPDRQPAPPAPDLPPPPPAHFVLRDSAPERRKRKTAVFHGGLVLAARDTSCWPLQVARYKLMRAQEMIEADAATVVKGVASGEETRFTSEFGSPKKSQADIA